MLIHLRKNDPKILLLSLVSLVIIISSCFILRYLAMPTKADSGVDVFYHIAMGDLYPQVAMKNEFPWTQLSLWKTNFHDKEMGFHAVIYSLRKWTGLLGINEAPPYNFISIVLVSLLLILLVLGGLSYNIRYSYLLPILVIGISPLFFLRVMMIRPHLFSIMIYSSVLFILISPWKTWWKSFALFFLSILYVYCYSSAHLIFIPLIAWVAANLISKRWEKKIFTRGAILILAAWGGLLTGSVIHPQFPNTFYNWYIQAITVGAKILYPSQSGIGIGLELLAPSRQVCWQNSGIIILLIINLLLMLKFKIRNVSILTFFLSQAIMLFGFFFSERCVEYCVPSGAICFIFLLKKIRYKFEFVKSENLLFKLFKKDVLLMIIVLLPITSMISLDFNYLKKSAMKPCYGFGKWAEKNLPPGTYVGHIRWGEFPRLFYVAPHCFYSMALDPMFTAAVNLDAITQLEDFRQLRKPLPPQELVKLLGTNLVFISKYDPVPAKYLLDQKVNVLYHGSDGWLFIIDYKDRS